jgi:hypothetical protein
MSPSRIPCAALLVAAMAGCNYLLDASSYHLADPADASTDGAVSGDACNDPSGLSGLGCYDCTPSGREEFLNHCTTAPCTPFDNSARLANLQAPTPPRPPTRRRPTPARPTRARPTPARVRAAR